jgi:hypothetical protein
MKVRITFQSPLTTIGEKGTGCVELLLGTILKGDKGDPGRDGNDGAPGQNGAPGKSAYEYAKEQGFSGTEEQFSQALAGVFLHENIGETDEVTI